MSRNAIAAAQCNGRRCLSRGHTANGGVGANLVVDVEVKTTWTQAAVDLIANTLYVVVTVRWVSNGFSRIIRTWSACYIQHNIQLQLRTLRPKTNMQNFITSINAHMQ